MATDTDVLIIGAGPTGLYAAYYAGFRGLRVAVVDSLPELGGQVTAMYPEKAILDVATFASTAGSEPTTLAAYIERMKEGQEEIYYLTGESRSQVANTSRW